MAFTLSVDTPSLTLAIIKWSWGGAPATLGTTAHIYFGRSGSGEAEKVAEVEAGAGLFLHELNATQRKWPAFEYRVRIVTADGATAYDKTVGVSRKKDPLGLALSDQVRKIVQQVTGIPVWFLSKKTWGDRCPTCFDEVRQRTGQGHCATCFGTTFTGGYGAPLPTHVSFSPNQEQIQQAGFAEIEPSQATIYLSHWPNLSVGDLLIEEDNRRWRVIQVQNTERLRTTFHQMAVVDEVESTSIEFSIDYPGTISI